MQEKDFIIIGAGQAGLCMAYYLKQQGHDFLLLDANHEIGDPWLHRWDSLKLFTPTEFNHLPGMDFPHKKGKYPNKYEVVDYLKYYCKKYQFPIELNQKVISLSKYKHKKKNQFILKTEQAEFKARQVIVATGPFHKPYTPECHKNINEDIFQIHSEYYKNPKQLRDGDTLVVGSGDSGIQILQEIADSSRQVYFSGQQNLPSIKQEFLGKTLWWWFTKTGYLSISRYNWLGKKLSQAHQPIIGINVKQLLAKDNIKCVGRTVSAQGNKINFEKRSVETIKNIIWATGFKPNFEWIKNVELNSDGYPLNYRGVSQHIAELYFVGLPWLYTRGSATLGGVKKDAKYLINYINQSHN